MKAWLGPSSWSGRATILACIVALPFAGFLASERYPLLCPESVVALLCLLVESALLAALFRGRAFSVLAWLGMAAISAIPLRQALSPLYTLPIPAAVWSAAFLLGALLWHLREDFFPLFGVFAAAAFLAHLGVSFRSRTAPVPAAQRTSPPPSHFLYLVLDEHLGPAGLPKTIEPCRQAAASIESTFRPYGFRLFPYAFSNYPATFESVPSLLNRSLPRRRHALLYPGSPDAYGVHFIDARRFFALFRSRGYQIRVFQDRAINYTRGEGVEAVEYTPQLGSVAGLQEPWTDRFRLLVGTYQSADRIRSSALKGFFPFRCGARRIGPLALTTVWPERLTQEILAARRPTFFFVHLLTPHGPYVYHADGSLRRSRDWALDMPYGRLSDADYTARYIRYAEQLQYVQSQLRGLLATLDRQALLDPMTVVVHGDHGSRILRRNARHVRLSPEFGMDDYDYSGEPELRDLLDRFSTLLAVKLPHRKEFSRDSRKASVLRCLSETIYAGEPSSAGADMDSSFLFDRAGNAREVRVTNLWNE